jgi:small-conductance mechanosensitive channel
MRIKSDLTLGVYKALTGAGIEIPFPQRDLRIVNADALTPGTQKGFHGRDKKEDRS